MDAGGSNYFWAFAKKLVRKYWNGTLKGGGDFSYKDVYTLSDGDRRGKVECHHVYVKSETYFAVVRVWRDWL